jgi:stalled ribosome alternative rescue factor ArfA
VADGISAEGELIEVQIGSFAPLKRKAPELVKLGRLRVVYPVMLAKYIEVYNAKGKREYRRKSPRRGSPYDLFNALVYAPELPLIRGLAIELVMLDASEQRIRDGKGSWRRKGLSIKDRQLLAVHERICLEKPADYLRFIPFTPAECFTSASLGERAGIRRELAQKTLYVLARLGIIEKTGKQRNAAVYRIIAGRNLPS